MADKVVSVWDGKEFRFEEAEKAEADAKAGLVQVWKGGQLGWDPGYNMKSLEEFAQIDTQQPVQVVEVATDEEQVDAAESEE